MPYSFNDISKSFTLRNALVHDMAYPWILAVRLFLHYNKNNNLKPKFKLKYNNTKLALRGLADIILASIAFVTRNHY